jgi:hypothetical protein
MPFPPLANETGLHVGNHVFVGNQDALQLADVAEDLGLGGICRTGSILAHPVVAKARDQFDTGVTGIRKVSRDVVEDGRVQGLACVAAENIEAADQGDVGSACGVAGLVIGQIGG